MSGPPRLPGSRGNGALAPEVIGPMLHDFPAVVEEIAVPVGGFHSVPKPCSGDASGVTRDRNPRERSAGRERAGQDFGRSDRELDREPGGAGGSGRESEHEKAVEQKPKTPDVDLGMRLPLPASGQHNADDVPRKVPRPTLRPPGGAGRPDSSGGPCGSGRSSHRAALGPIERVLRRHGDVPAGPSGAVGPASPSTEPVAGPPRRRGHRR